MTRLLRKLREGLVRILLLQRGSSYMIDHTLGMQTIPRPRARSLQQRSISSMWAKKRPSSPSRFAIVRQTDEHGCTGSPEYRQYGVILPPVRFDYSHHPSPTKRISVAVDESADSSGIFEPFFCRQLRIFGWQAATSGWASR